jgi:hypothetical protein
MNREETIRKLTKLADQVMIAKGKDYTAGNWETDPNYNFNEIARLLQGAPINPYTVCMIYFLKHVFSLIKYAKTGTQEGGEGLEGRHVDALNYVRILWSLLGERVEEELKATEDAEFDDKMALWGRSPIDMLKGTVITPCECPSCRRTRERDAQFAQDWLDRVNAELNKNTQK